jgi:hypothetical protein
MMIEIDRLVEADGHLFAAHRQLKRQRHVVTELKANGRHFQSANELLVLMKLMMPIREDLRQ